MRVVSLRSPGARLLTTHLRGSRGAVAGIAVWSVVEAAPALSSGWAIARALDDGFLAHRPGVGMAWLAVLAVLYVVEAVAERALFGYFANLVEPMRDGLVRHVVTGALARGVQGRVDHNTGADAASVARLTRQVESVRGLVGALLRTVRPVAVTVVAAVAGLSALAPVLLPLVLPPLLVALLVYPVTMRVLARRRRVVMLTDERVAAVTGRVLLGARDIASLGAEERATGELGDAARRHARATVAMARVGALRVLLDTVGGHLPVVLVLVAGPWALHRGSLSPGQLVGAIAYLTGHLLPAVRTLTGIVSGYLVQLGVVLDRLAQTAGAPPDDRGSDGPRHAEVLTLRGVSFSYGPNAAPVVRDLDLTVPAGGYLAVVGASGIGKSTLAGLMAGMDAPDEGTVTLGDVEVAALRTSARRRLVAYLPQQAYVFAGTVRENLRYLAPDVTDPALDDAVDAVGLRRLLTRLGGYDAVLDDPATELSAGERQLLALARAYVSPAALVILDEATCHLDPAAERRAEAAFARRAGTLVVVAHRVSSAERADLVLMLHEDGHTVGPPNRLAATCPPYADIVAAARPPVDPAANAASARVPAATAE